MTDYRIPDDLGNATFGDVLKALADGKRARLSHWPESDFIKCEFIGEDIIRRNKAMTSHSYIARMFGQSYCVWMPSFLDMFCEHWQILE